MVEPVLGCAARGINPPCPAVPPGRKGSLRAHRLRPLRPGLQTGYCADTGGGWSEELVAHESQLHDVPDELSDEAAVMVEPTACAVHAAAARRHQPAASASSCSAPAPSGCCVIAALRHFCLPAALIAVAKHPDAARLRPGARRRPVVSRRTSSHAPCGD